MTRAILLTLIGLLIAGCAASTSSEQAARITDPAAVLGLTWQWEATESPAETITVADPERYTFMLGPSDKAQLRFDCNRGGGSYHIGSGTLVFGPMISTRMACPPDSLDAPFMRDLERVETFFVADETLFLGLKEGGGTMRFRPATSSTAPAQ